MSKRRTGEGADRRRGVRAAVSIAVAALACAVIVLLAGPCSASAPPGDTPADGASADASADASAEPRHREHVRPTTSPETPPVDAGTAEPSGPFLQRDGWPLAEVLVHHADGRPAEDAVVWVLPAGERCGALQFVARAMTDAEGRARIAVAWAGRFDIGAFHPTSVFHTLVGDVELPTGEPVVVTLPTLAAIEVRIEGEPPSDRLASFVPAGAERIRAFPGRGETKYRSFEIEEGTVLVPRGVPMRVQTPPGVVATPGEVTAPGEVVLRDDGRRYTSIRVRITGQGRFEDRRAILRGVVELQDGPPDARHEFRIGTRLSSDTTFTAALHLPQEPCLLRWELEGVGEGSVPVPRAALRDPGGVSVTIPVADWSRVAAGLPVMVHRGESGKAASTTIIQLDNGTRTVVWPETSTPIDAEVGTSVVAVARAGAEWFVSDPAPVRGEGVTTLTLRRAGAVRIRAEGPSALSSAWDLSVVRENGGPMVTDGGPPRASTVLAISAGETRIEALPPGDTVLVLRMRGRPVERRTISVHAGQTTDVTFAPQTPPLDPGDR